MKIEDFKNASKFEKKLKKLAKKHNLLVQGYDPNHRLDNFQIIVRLRKKPIILNVFISYPS